MARQSVMERTQQVLHGAPASPTLHVPQHPEVPDELHRHIDAQHDAVRTQEHERIDNDLRRVAKLVVPAREQKATLIGSHRSDVRAFMEEQRRRKAATTSEGWPSRRERARVLAEQRTRFADHVRELGIDAAKVRAENIRAGEEWQRGGSHIDFDKVGPVGQGGAQPLSHEPGVLHFPPPHDVGTWLSHQQVQSDKFAFTGFFLDWAPSGSLGHVNQTEISGDVDDFELSVAQMRSLFGFWLQLPEGTKTVAISVEMESIKTFHAFFLEDEYWGDSASSVKQRSDLFSELIGVDGGIQARRGLSSLGGPPKFDDPDESEGSLQVAFHPKGSELERGWMSAVPELGDSGWVFAWIGLETTNEHFVDDVDGLSGVTSRWRFKDILIKPVS